MAGGAPLQWRVFSWSYGPRASSSLMNLSELEARGPEDMIAPLEWRAPSKESSRNDECLVRLQSVDLRLADPRLAQHLDAVAAEARRVAAVLDLGLLEIERAGEGLDRALARMFALGEEAGRLEMRIVE